MSISEALARLVDALLRLTDDRLLQCPLDTEWRSPCEVHSTHAVTWWRPVKQSPSVDFSGLAQALETPIHPDICQFYGSYWSGTLEMDSQEGRVSLIQLWNEEDFDRLIANFIGQALAKRRQRQPLSLFIANTEPDSEHFLSIDNATGAVLLELPGKPPLRRVEDKLGTFLSRLTPTLRSPDLY